jgi:hypothetical protein
MLSSRINSNDDRGKDGRGGGGWGKKNTTIKNWAIVSWKCPGNRFKVMVVVTTMW